MSTYGERLRMYRKHAKLTQKELADKLGIDNSLISNWERDINKYDIDMLLPLSEALNISVNDLVGFYTDFSLDNEEEELVKTYRSLDESDKKTLLKLGKALESLNNSAKKALNKVKEMISYPVHTTPASAGTGSFLDADNYELVDIPDEVIPRESNFAVRVSGNSMEPDYKNGSIVFVKQTKEISPGEVGLFIVNNEGFIKILGDSDNLKSINPEYNDIKIGPYDECRIVGKVLGGYNGI